MSSRIEKSISAIWVENGRVFCKMKGSRQIMRAYITRVHGTGMSV